MKTAKLKLQMVRDLLDTLEEAGVEELEIVTPDLNSKTELEPIKNDLPPLDAKIK